MRAELVVDASRLESFREEWDALAEAAGQPYAAPGWLLPWLRHAAPSDAALRTVAVTDEEGLVGIAPLMTDPAGGYAALGSGACSGVEPLARPGVERPVAEAIAQTLASSEPAPRAVAFEGLSARSPWPGLIAAAWPGAPAEVVLDRTERGPFARGDSYETWFAARTAHFRKRMRRARRELEERGATFRLSGADDLDAFAALHRERWADRGGSGVLTPGVEAMLAEVARELGPERFRVWVLEAEGEPVAAEIMIAAGTTSTFWLGGFKETWRSAQPSIQTMLRALEHAFESGDRRIDLGEGGQDFKYRLADGDDELRWTVVVPRGPGYRQTRARLRARAARRNVAEFLPVRAKRLLKATRRAG